MPSTIYRFLGISEISSRIREMIKVVARKDTTILLRGESGSGKECAARLVHQQSLRSERRFVAIDCPSITETICESELFGHQKGAFTGSMGNEGLVRAADGGTLFLDEVGDMDLAIQRKLLRVLNDLENGSHEVRRVGAALPSSVNFRLIAATHQNLEELVERGMFREDLYFRLNGFTISLPPLRERKEDIPLLAESFLREMKLSPEAMSLLLNHSWPGNVRELQKVLEAACICADLRSDTKILQEDLRFAEIRPILRRKWSNNSLGEVLFSNAPIPIGFSLPEVIEEIERPILEKALRQCGYNQPVAAKLLGMVRRNFTYRCYKRGVMSTAAKASAAKAGTD